MSSPHSKKSYLSERFVSPGGGIGRRKGLKIPRAISCRFDSGPGQMKLFNSYSIFIYNIMWKNTCAIINNSSEPNNIQKVNYGKSPDNYQKFLKIT